MEEQQPQSDPHLAVSKLKQQNEKLRTELEALTKILDTALHKQRQAEKESKRPKFSGQEDKELASIHSQINRLKKERNTLQLQLSANADNNTTDLENQLAFLKKRYKEIQEEQKTLNKLQKVQERSHDSITNTATLEERAEKLREEVKKTKDEYRDVIHKFKTDEIKWKQDHQRMVALDERTREATSKKKKPKEETKTTVNKNKPENELTELQKRIDILKNAIASDEKVLKIKVADAENSAKTMQEKLQGMHERLKAKEEDSQLKDIKIKELKSTVRNLELKLNAEQAENNS